MKPVINFTIQAKVARDQVKDLNRELISILEKSCLSYLIVDDSIVLNNPSKAELGDVLHKAMEIYRKALHNLAKR